MKKPTLDTDEQDIEDNLEKGKRVKNEEALKADLLKAAMNHISKPNPKDTKSD